MTKKQIENQYNTVYKAAIAYIQKLLEKNGLRYVELQYDLFYPAFNMNISTGDTYKILSLRYYPEGSSPKYSGLIAFTEEGETFPLGTDIDGQDNYIITDVVFLINGVEAAVKQFNQHLIRCQGNTKDDILQAIAASMPYHCQLVFQSDLHPSSFHGKQIPEHLRWSKLTQKELWLQTVSGEKSLQLKDLPAARLMYIVRTVNDYVRYIYNNKHLTEAEAY